MDDPSGWSLTESDPQVFSELLRNLGVKGLQVVIRPLTHLRARYRRTATTAQQACDIHWSK